MKVAGYRQPRAAEAGAATLSIVVYVMLGILARANVFCKLFYW